MDDHQQLYSTQQVADMLRLHPGHVRRLAVRYNVGRVIGKQRIFTRAEVDELRKRKTTPGRVRRDPR